MKPAKARELPLRKHGKKIADRQHGLKGIADIGIDLFVWLCVLSRVFAQQAKRRKANLVRRITRTEDEEMSRLAGFILDRGSCPWDVVS